MNLSGDIFVILTTKVHACMSRLRRDVRKVPNLNCNTTARVATIAEDRMYLRIMNDGWFEVTVAGWKVQVLRLLLVAPPMCTALQRICMCQTLTKPFPSLHKYYFALQVLNKGLEMFIVSLCMVGCCKQVHDLLLV